MNLLQLTKEIEEVSLKYVNKFKINRDADWFVMKLQEEVGELTQTYLMLIRQARNKDKSQKEIMKNFEGEIADVLCHLLLLAKHYQIDLEKVIEEKWLKWNKI